MNKVIEIKNLTKCYGDLIALDDFSLDVYEGEILGLLGPNGSGKSTLFKTVLGLVPALAGQLSVLNQPLARWSRRQLARQIAYVPQQSVSLFSFTALDMVLMGRSAYTGLFSTPSKNDKEKVWSCLEHLGIEHLAERLFPQLSGGEQQLVLLARALAQEPKALILDEPTSSLDFGNQILVIEQVQQLKKQGLAIFLCTHQPEHAMRMADKALLLAKGKVFAQGAVHEVLSINNLATMYGLSDDRVCDYLETSLSKFQAD